MNYSIRTLLARPLSLFILITLVLGCALWSVQAQTAPSAKTVELVPLPMIPYSPQTYLCYRTPQQIQIDGRMDDPSWKDAIWTNPFVDIEGNLKPAPRFATRAKMLWDSVYLYVGAELEEPDIWGKLTRRDAVIYHDNDFELFIDPDMDTHEYYELELNALNTVWDLLLLKPYRDGGPAVNAWDIQGLKTAVTVHGTLNQAGDTDSGWSVEIAVPWTVLAECAHRPSPPQDGDQWKVNFSRVEWQTEVKNGTYTKLLDPATGKSLPENNWVWSPQGLIAMHYPEMWGMVQFSTELCGSRSVPFVSDPADSARWLLRRLFYAERNYYSLNGKYTSAIGDLNLGQVSLSGFAWPPELQATDHQFEASLSENTGKLRLRIVQDGQVTTENR